MKNWKTTLSGLVVAVCGFILFDPQWFHPVIVSIAKFCAIGGIASLGLAAKDFNITGKGNKK